MRKTVFLILAVSLILTHEPAWAFLNLFSIGTEDEVAIGRKIARSVERKMPIYRDLDYEKRLIRVGYRLVNVCDRRDLKYTFTIIDKDEMNAFATFGGYIYIYKGVMDKLDSDDELASILAHEIGHVSLRHLAKRAEESQSMSLGMSLLDAFVLRKQKHRRDIQRAVGTAYNIIQRGYSREDEFEADRLGVRYCHRAGYRPLAAISVMDKVSQEKRSRGISSPFENIDILRTHPYMDERKAAVFFEYSQIKAEAAYKNRMGKKRP